MVMNKEIIVAVSIGIMLGIFGALYLSNSQPKGKASDILINSMEITPRITAKTSKLAMFDKLPESNTITNASALTLSGKAGKDLGIFAGNILGLHHLPVKDGKFEFKLPLKPGLNEVAIFETGGENERLKILKIYYLAPAPSIVARTDSEEKKATDEAEVLKDKLEQKVLELREKARRAQTGEVDSISDKELILKTGGQTVKVNLESEVTKFYSAADKDLTELAIGDVKKGDTLTAFISEIAGEEKSYTVYKEPAKTLAVGKVSNVDSDNYRVTIINFDKTSIPADVETGTVRNYFNAKSGGLETAGFSKIGIGQRILALMTGSSLDQYIIIDTK